MPLRPCYSVECPSLAPPLLSGPGRHPSHRCSGPSAEEEPRNASGPRLCSLVRGLLDPRLRGDGGMVLGS